MQTLRFIHNQSQKASSKRTVMMLITSAGLSKSHRYRLITKISKLTYARPLLSSLDFRMNQKDILTWRKS